MYRERFDAFYRAYLAQCLNFCYRFVYDKQEAEDIVADAFIRYWDNKIDLTDLEKAKATLFTIIKNVAVDKWRRKNRYASIEQELAYREQLDKNADLAELETDVINKLYTDVSSLPAAERNCLSLHLEGKPSRKIAELLKLPVAEVYRLRASAVRRLKKLCASIKK